MSKARDLANAGTAFTAVSSTELAYVDGVTSAIQTQLDAKEATLPSQAGNSGKYLTTNGTAKSWGTVTQYALPSQTGNSGKFLTTNGTAESWGTVTPGGMTLLGSATPTGVNTYTFSSISGSYKRLYLQFSALTTLAAATVAIRINGVTGTNCYTGVMSRSTTTANVNTGGTSTYLHGQFTVSNSLDGGITFYNYASTATSGKTFTWALTDYKSGTAETFQGVGAIVGSTANGYEGCGAVTSITIFNQAGQNFDSGSIYLYGEN